MMKKATIEYNQKTLDSFLNEIQSQLPNVDVNINNVNNFSLMLEERKNCASCKGLNNCKNTEKGNYTICENNTFKYEACKYMREFALETKKTSLIETLYLPKKILEADIANFDVNTESRKKIFKKINDFIIDLKNGNTSKGLYLYGSFSVGKTFTLACLANELARNDIKSLLIYFPDLVSDMKQAIGTDRLAEIVNMLKSIDVLMLDDLGSENLTLWVRDEILGPVINYRLLEGKPIFISSNISPTDLKKHLMIEKGSENELKAERIIERLKALVTSISMDDTSQYKRSL